MNWEQWNIQEINNNGEKLLTSLCDGWRSIKTHFVLFMLFVFSSFRFLADVICLCLHIQLRNRYEPFWISSIIICLDKLTFIYTGKPVNFCLPLCRVHGLFMCKATLLSRKTGWIYKGLQHSKYITESYNYNNNNNKSSLLGMYYLWSDPRASAETKSSASESDLVLRFYRVLIALAESINIVIGLICNNQVEREFIRIWSPACHGASADCRT